MKIYTKRGDAGTTDLIGGARVAKTDPRVEAYGTVDELLAFTALLSDKLRDEEGLGAIADELLRVEGDLMTLAAVLAAGSSSGAAATETTGSAAPLRLRSGAVGFLEEQIDLMQRELPPAGGFTLPGGHKDVSLAHVCRTVCRRAERAALRAVEAAGPEDAPTPPEALAYLNRLSDYFYVLTRFLAAYFKVEERVWRP